ncbi:hypothetical protein [Bradyrhizobium sp.]|uniref:hypothetical protein n=1 Tax=Bradyrhizobium sp. TaxID=376 RepID=UPI001EC33BC7|nr:hypothetical protein [Bradyrhizobium sp.]MBV8920547.1 hypothetical protein [Bradyrhizobium sp.]MBV9978838.1 hypothetical protein [Bradyrhizobium sp.]
MSTAATLLARKQQLTERLHEAPGPHERDELERLLAQIDAALDLLDGAPPESDEEPSS